jgi:hypothetical protein
MFFDEITLSSATLYNYQISFKYYPDNSGFFCIVSEVSPHIGIAVLIEYWNFKQCKKR